jgi:hypothetical protein
MLGQIARKAKDALEHRHAPLTACKVPAWGDRKRLQFGHRRRSGKIEAMRDVRHRAGRAVCQAAQIEGQPFAKQLHPSLVLCICAASGGRHRLALRNKQPRRSVGGRIMAERDSMLARYKSQYRSARGPFARREQQVQPCGISVLRR